MARPDDLLFVGTHGHVRAIHKRTGRRAWDTSLPGTGYTLVSVLYEDGVVFAASHGHVFGLDAATGAIRWKNALKGLGYDDVSLATSRQATDDLTVRVKKKAAAARRT